MRGRFPAVSQQGSQGTDGNKKVGTFMLARDNVANQAEVAGTLFRDWRQLNRMVRDNETRRFFAHGSGRHAETLSPR